MIKFFILLLTLSISHPMLAEEPDVDPWEGFNRKVYAFNDTVDQYFLKPVAVGYNTVTPTFLNKGLTHMFSNVGEIITTGNSLLQAKPKVMGNAILRFVINTTVGVFGFFDVATQWGFEQQKEDFGQTLAVWGVPSGPYLILPFLGPSVVRDTGGFTVDIYTNPAEIDHVPTRNSMYGVKLVDTRADLIKMEDLITGDRYVFIRNAYLQNRHNLINDGIVEDNFGEMESVEEESFEDEPFSDEPVNGEVINEEAINEDTNGETDTEDDWLE